MDKLILTKNNIIKYIEKNESYQYIQNEDESIKDFFYKINNILEINKLNKEDNIILAKRMIVDNIYSSARIEGIGATFADTEAIINNAQINSHLRPNDITFIINMKRAWEFILDDKNIDRVIDLAFLQELHEIVGRGLETLKWDEIGKFRIDGVRISGTTWRPSIPNIEQLHDELIKLNNIKDSVERGINLNLWICRRQIFKDGNKRIGNLIFNHELIKNGAGIFMVRENYDSLYKQLLVDFYESAISTNIKEFILNNAYINDKDGLIYSERNKNNSNESEDFLQ